MPKEKEPNGLKRSQGKKNVLFHKNEQIIISLLVGGGYPQSIVINIYCKSGERTYFLFWDICFPHEMMCKDTHFVET